MAKEKVDSTRTESGIDSESTGTTENTIETKEVTFDLSVITPMTELGPEAPDDTILKPRDVIYEAESPDEEHVLKLFSTKV